MKKVIVMVLLCIASMQVFSQTWDEWVRQKKTQLKYLREQIAALMVYREFIQKGYAIARDGLHVIADIKQSDFDLHNGYFHSLQDIKPTIAGYSKVTKAFAIHANIQRQVKATHRLLSADLLAHTADYCKKVMLLFSDDVKENMSQLHLLITDGNYALTDDERLQRIEKICDRFADQYQFSKSFHTAVTSIVANRQTELNDGRALQKMYNLNIP